MPRGLWLAACALVMLATAREGRAQAFKAQSLRVGGEVKEVRSADLDGDGRRELLVSSTLHPQGSPERQLYVCGWTGKGTELRTVLQDTWKVPREAVFWDVGPAGGAAEGKHIYFLSIDGLSEVGKFGFAPVLRIEEPVLLSVGQEDEFLGMDFIRDWDGDGREEAMLPLGRQARFYRWEWTEGWVLVDSAKIWPLAYYSNNILFGRNLGGYQYLSLLLYPILEAVDLNGDGRKDLLGLRNGKGFCYLRGENGKLGPEPFLWDLEIRSEEEIARHRATLSYRVADLNRDGCADVIVHKLVMSFADWNAETAVFLGRPESFRPKEPEQRFPASGFFSGVSLDDLDGDGYPDVTVWSVKMGLVPLMEILLRKAVHINSHSYYGAWPKGFSAKAENEGNFVLHIDSDRPDFIRGLMPNTEGDFNRDGIKDLVAEKGADRLVIYLGLPERKFDSQPWAVLDAPEVNYARAEDVDGDGLCDLYGYQVEKGGNLSRLHVWIQGPLEKP
ncbi:MAG: FG-GAP repeat domain-containing protein [Thermodesulfobacteriota bacterium]